MKKIVGLLSICVLAAGASTSHAAERIIGIDFGNTVPVAGSNFNQYSDAVGTAAGATNFYPGTLIDITGADVTGVGFSVINNAATLSIIEIANPGEEGVGLMTNVSIYGDAILIARDDGTSDDSVTLTFTGLDKASTYNLVGGFDQNSGTHGTVWEVDGESFTTQPHTAVGGFASFTNLFADGSGNLAITVTENSRYIAVAGLTLEIIPPSATAIMVQ